MKKNKYLLLGGYALALLTGCNTEVGFKSCEINDYPKTTFYCGEEFSNTGISLKVNLTNGESFIVEDVATSHPTTNLPGTQTVKVYYTNDEYDVDTYITYEINVIDWSKEEKAIFSETSLSSIAGIYYPKMEGMNLLAETDDETGEIVDYWIEKENASFEDFETYQDLLRNYSATKNISGTDVYFKFYEQSSVPSDFYDYYDDIHDAVSYKYCGSYIYTDTTYYEEYELYAYQVEDTLVIGFNEDNDLIVRFIANSVYLDANFSCEVNERLTLESLYSGTVLSYLNQVLLGYTDETSGDSYSGLIQSLAPLAIPYFVVPNYEADVCAFADYCAMYPWLHENDVLCFEVQIGSDDEDEYNDFVAELDAVSGFTKEVKEDDTYGEDVNVTSYSIIDAPYVGSLTIEVTDFISDGLSFYETLGTTRTEVTIGCYYVYYRFQYPEIVSPAEEEVFRIYDLYYGDGNYDYEDYDVYEDGSIGGLIAYKKTDVASKEDAIEKFANDYLTGYTLSEAISETTISSITVATAKYTTEDFIVTVYSYYSGGKYYVEFLIDMVSVEA